MEVKCKFCKNKINRDSAYKVTTYTKSGTKRNNYYCSEEECNNDIAEKQYKNDFYHMIIQYFAGMKSVGSLPKILFSEMTGIAEQYNWKSIYEYTINDKEYLDKCMKKEFASDWARGKYLVAVFRSNVGKDLSWRSGNAKVTDDIVKETNYNDFVAPIYKKVDKKQTTRVAFDDLI